MPPTVFWPRPKVYSAIIHITTDQEKRAAVRNLKFFHEFVRAMFFHRRKFLRSELLSAFKKTLDKPQVDSIMAEMQISNKARAEELEPRQFVDLCHAVLDRVPENCKIL
jgi:16S rRNA (adenine1518-N6/adenine1519-N6)-dimethyltransferase